MHNKGNYKQDEKQEWQKTTTIEATNKRLISKIYEQLISPISEKQTIHQQMGRRFKTDISPKKTYKGKIHVKKCSTSLLTREMQIKTTMSYQLTPIRTTLIKKYTNNKCWRGCRANGTLLHFWWGCKQYRHCGEQHGDFLKK